MALQRTSLTKVVQLTTSPAAVYPNPADSKSNVKGFLLHNTGASTVHVTANWVQPAGSATAANQILSLDLAAGETLTFEVPFVLILTEEAEAIFAVADTAATVNICVLGDIDQ